MRIAAIIPQRAIWIRHLPNKLPPNDQVDKSRMTKQNNAKWYGKTTTAVFGTQQLPEIGLMPVVAECLR